jgi:glycosyltransferase involved in cell wall biosynthesis
VTLVYNQSNDGRGWGESEKYSISAFFPAFNDGGTIGSIVVMALKTLRDISDNYEIIVVNDGSTDYTEQILNELQEQYESLKVIHHETNRGYGAALITGFSNCTKDLIFYTDGDGQYDVRELSTLLTAFNTKIDWVNGYKISRSDPFHRKVIGRIYHWIAKIMFGLRLRDVDCDFRLLRRGMFEKIKLKSTSGVICVEMIKKFQNAGFQFAEVPVHHYFRAYGKSQFFNYPRIFRIGFQLIALWVQLVLKRKKQIC